MSKGATIHIFRAGTHTAMGGQTVSFSEEWVSGCAATYNPQVHEAPLVVGHPTHDAPARGWVASAAATGPDLSVAADQIDPAFAEAVRRGDWKKISASFYMPGSPAHPLGAAAEFPYLRHVGFLGAMPPSVKGLRPVNFGEAEEGVVTVEFGELERRWGFEALAGLARGVREWIIGKYGQEEADKVVPGHLIDDISRAAQPDPEPAPVAPAFQEPTPEVGMTAEELAAREAGLKKREEEANARAAAFAEREAALGKAEQKGRRDAATALVGGYVAAGKVLPRQQAGLVELVAFCDAAPADQVLEFGEGDGKKKEAPGAVLRELLAGLPVQVEYGERAGGTADFGEETPEAMAQRVTAYRNEQAGKGVTLSFAEAVAFVSKGR